MLLNCEPELQVDIMWRLLILILSLLLGVSFNQCRRGEGRGGRRPPFLRVLCGRTLLFRVGIIIIMTFTLSFTHQTVTNSQIVSLECHLCVRGCLEASGSTPDGDQHGAALCVGDRRVQRSVGPSVLNCLPGFELGGCSLGPLDP